MKSTYLVIVLLTLSFEGCSDLGPELGTGYQEVFLICVDKVSMGGTLQAVIRSQEEYDRLILDRFTKPLQDYWNENYQSVLEIVRRRYPGLTEQQYADSVRRIFYSTPPFMGTENCSHPSFDFAKYALLGQDSHGTGCRQPDYTINVSSDNETRTVIFTVSILQHGLCEIAFNRNTWVLVPRLPPGYTVRFQKEYSRDDEW
jgi:hypothetical protein